MSFSLYQCDLCLKRKSVRLIPLMNHERVFPVKLSRKWKKSELIWVLPNLACVNCFKKLSFFKYSFSDSSKPFTLNVSNKRMHRSNIPSGETSEGSKSVRTCLTQCLCGQCPKDEVVPLAEDTSKSVIVPEKTDEETCSGDYNCTCETCRNKYGSLPLLLQGIEQKTKEETEPQPSTSGRQMDREQSVSKKSLVCQYCNKNFYHKGDFNKHLRKHTKEQPFSCDVCSRKFAHTSNLQRHLRLHTGQRPFVCQNCDKRFSRKDKLESHKKSKLCQRTHSNL